MFDYDVIIAGAGIGGKTLAYKLAREGIDILLIDMKPQEKIGLKVCGDGISASYFEKLNIPKPHGRELASIINASEVLSPDKQSTLIVEGLGYTIDRLEFEQRLLKDALAKGVHLLDNTHVLGPIIEENAVKGAMVKDNKTSEIKKIRAKITIDATGQTAAIRNRLPNNFLIEKSIDRFDIAAAYREIIALRDEPMWETDKIYIYLSHKYAPGGYTWIFPKGKMIANIGIGVQPLENGPSPVHLLEIFYKDWKIQKSEVIHAGGGFVPVRRCLSQIVGNGLILIGDAASQANPLHGGGMGHAMIAACIAAEVIAQGIESRENILTIHDLWPYAVRYMRTDGAKNAALEIIRLLLQGMTDEEINFIMREKIVSGDELYQLESRPKESSGIWRKILKSVMKGKIGLLRRLKIAKDLYFEMYHHFHAYPDNPKDLTKWHMKTMSIVKEAREKLWRNPVEHTFLRR